MHPHYHNNHHKQAFPKQAFAAALDGDVAGYCLAVQGVQADMDMSRKRIQAVDAVVQIRSASHGFGTGFVVDVIDPAYLPPNSDTTIVVMTNHHVIPDQATARQASATAFNDDRNDRPEQRLDFKFSTLLYTSTPGPWSELGRQDANPNPLLDGYDFSVLQLAPGEAARLQRRGMVPLKVATPAEIGAFRRGFDRQLMSHPEVLVIQHPQGGLKKISSPLPKCYKYGAETVTAIPFVKHELANFPHTAEIAIATDNSGAEASQPGSSGSPILDATSLSVLGILWGGVTAKRNLRFTFGTTFETMSIIIDRLKQQTPQTQFSQFPPPQPPLPSPAQQGSPKPPAVQIPGISGGPTGKGGKGGKSGKGGQTLQQQPQYSHANTNSKSKSQAKGKGGYKGKSYPQQQSLPQQQHYYQSKAKPKYPLSQTYVQQKSLWQQQPQQQPQYSHPHHKTKSKWQGKGKGGFT